MLFDIALPPCFQLKELYYNILCERIYEASALIPNLRSRQLLKNCFMEKSHSA